MEVRGPEHAHDGEAGVGHEPQHLDAGERVALITLGDPNVYSTFSSVAERVAALRPRTPVRTEPGIMAFQELAARTGTVPYRSRWNALAR